MKLFILTSSAQYLLSAGVRIRYQRLKAHLTALGCQMDIMTIDDFEPAMVSTKRDVVLFSKVQDARGIVLAHELDFKGVRVGVDLFDDYFSQTSDARFAPQRLWLTKMADLANFFLCSTKRMKEIAARYFGEKPGHILNDAFENFDPERLGSRIDVKQQAAIDSRCIDILWFGMGDNPNFPVGLHDLSHYSRSLDDFRRLGFEVRLKVLTNIRALNNAGLNLLRDLPVRPSVEEWTQDREIALLDGSLLSFLPVNGQGFSIAKSLNRAVTALTGGTQILSAGYPLYASLDAFLYRDAHALVRDLLSGTLRASTSQFHALGEQLDRISNPRAEAHALYDFLKSLPIPPSGDSPAALRLAILHGTQSTGAVHKFALKRQWLSFGSPHTPAGLPYDAHLTTEDALVVRLSARAAKLLSPAFANRAYPADNEAKHFYLELQKIDMDPDVHAILTYARSASDTAGAALYAEVMDATRSVYTNIFGHIDYAISELNPILCQSQELANRAIRANY